MSTMPVTFTEEGRFERNPLDFYETPFNLALSACKIVNNLWPNPCRVLDPGCGTGVWGRAARQVWPTTFIGGIDVGRQFEQRQPYDDFIWGDFLNYRPTQSFNAVIGNPPYSSKKNRNLAAHFVHHALRSVAPGGVVAFLLKTEFLGSYIRYATLFTSHRPYAVFQSVRRVPFYKHTKKTNTYEYALFVWLHTQKQPEQTLLKWWEWREGEANTW